MISKALFNRIIEKFQLYRFSAVVYKLYSIYQNILVKIKFSNKPIYKLDIKGELVKYDTRDAYSKKWFYLFNQDEQLTYENSVTKYLEKNLKPNSCFLDLGTHIGYYTCIAASLLNDGEVHAFEVDKNCHKFIHNNININGFKNIKVNLMAVSDTLEGEYIPDISSPNNKLSIFVTDYKKRLVPSTTVDEYIKKNKLKPDFIKIDVEAAESKVIRGMKKTLSLSPLTLLIELHIKTLRKLGFNPEEIIGDLLNSGFDIYELKQFRKQNFEKVRLTENSELKNDTFIIAEKT